MFRHPKKLGVVSLACFVFIFSAFIVGCGGDKKEETGKISIKFLLVGIPQSDSKAFDLLEIKGKMLDSKKSKKVPLTWFKVRKEIDLEDLRGFGIKVLKGGLKPGKWKISIKYTRAGTILDLNKGYKKFEVDIALGRDVKKYFTYNQEKGINEVSENMAKEEEKEFFLRGQNKIKERTFEEAEPDYEKEGY